MRTRNLRAYVIGLVGAVACLAPFGGTVAAAAPAAQATVSVEGLPFNVRAQNSNKCLDIAGGPGATGDGAPAIIWDCYGPRADQPAVVPVRLHGARRPPDHQVHSGKCLDVLGGPAAINNGNAVAQWDCLGDKWTNQRWYLTTP